MSQGNDGREEIEDGGSSLASPVASAIPSHGAGNMDVMSPYYIHPSNNPGQVFVTDLLHDGNYGEWVNDMTNAMYAKNKIGFIDGTLARPPPSSMDLSYWLRADAMVKGWLKTAMNKDVRSSVRYAKSAYEIWVDVAERFGKGSAPRAYELRRAITSFRQDGSSVSTYYTKLKALWDEMHAINPLPRCSCLKCDCGLQKQVSDMRAKEQLYDFLMGLDDVFSTIKTQILSMSCLPSIGIAYHMVSEDEQQRALSNTRRVAGESGVAFQASRGNKPQTRGPSAAQNAPTGRRTDGKPRCNYYNKIGHVEEGCFKLIGYPSDWNRRPTRDQEDKDHRDRGQGSTNARPPPRAAQVDAQGASQESPIPGFTAEQFSSLMKHFGPRSEAQISPSTSEPLANMAGNDTEPLYWVIDSGATDNITCNSDWLINFTRNSAFPSVKIPNGDGVAVEGIGTVPLTDVLHLDHVLYIPKFKCNLLSVSRLTKELNCTLTFLATKRLIGVGRLCNGLYKFASLREGMAMMTQATVDIERWHKHLGHASCETMRHILDFPISSNSTFPAL